MLGKFYQYKDNKGTNWPLYRNMQVMLSLGEGAFHFVAVLLLLTRKNDGQTTEDWSATDRRLIGERSPIKPCLQKCRRLVWFSMLQRIPLADQTVLTTGRRSRQSFADHRKPPKTTPKKSGCRRSARGCRCNSLTTNRRLVGDHRQTFADL